MNSDFTILIQGPIRNSVLDECIPEYKKIGNVVFVSYINDKEIKHTGIQVIKVPLPDTTNTFNYNNTFLQTYGILEGLKQINTKFTIRVRSDESFPVLDTFISNIYKYPEKIHVTNLYSFKDNEHKYCLGNHLFAGKTETLLDATRWAYDVCTFKNKQNIHLENNVLLYTDKEGNKIPMWSEILQTISFLKSFGVEINASKSREQIIENFYLTPLTDLPNFKWSHKFNNYEPITKDTKMEYDPSWTDSFTVPNRFLTKIEDI